MVGDEVGVGAAQQHRPELLHRLVPHLLTTRGVVVVVAAPRVVDQHVDPAVPLEHVAQQGFDLPGLGVVAPVPTRRRRRPPGRRPACPRG